MAINVNISIGSIAMLTEAERSYQKVYQTAYYQCPEAREKRRQYSKRYYQCNKEKIKIRHAKYYRSYYRLHRERKVRYERKYRQLHPEKAREQHRKYRQSHPAKSREYYQLHKKTIAACARRWKRAYPGRVALHTHRHLGKGFVPLAPNIFDCPVDWHHIAPNQPYVVPIPRAIHEKFGGPKHYVIIASFMPLLFGCM